MKYIKLFETNLYDKRFYWLIPTDDRFEKSLREIGCSDGTIEQFENTLNLFEKPYFFIGYSPNGLFGHSDIEQWDWDEFQNNMTDADFEKHGYTFKGAINIEQIELDTLKFNI